MIYTINYIFNREQNSIGTESNITYLSLASIKAKKSYELIMGHPGNLSKIIEKEKYISFDNFISAVQNVYDYKYSLMPLFISLKTSLNINRNEKELEINKNNFNDYSRILKEVFSGYKKRGDIGVSNFDFKNNLELEKKKKKIIIKNDNNMNNTQIKTGNMIINSQQYTNLGTLSNNNNSSIFGNSNIKNDSGINLKKNQNCRYNVYYNKICGLEVFPAKFKEVEKDYNINNKVRKTKRRNA